MFILCTVLCKLGIFQWYISTGLQPLKWSVLFGWIWSLIKYGFACGISKYIECVYDMLGSRQRQHLWRRSMGGVLLLPLSGQRLTEWNKSLIMLVYSINQFILKIAVVIITWSQFARENTRNSQLPVLNARICCYSLAFLNVVWIYCR